MRKFKISPNEHYHVLNRGNNKQNIFIDGRDWIRFLFLVLYFQSPERFFNINRPVSNYVKHRVFNIAKEKTIKIITDRKIELINFCLIPNHFHLLLKETAGGGISQYMQRVQDSYTKYFNTKYGKIGHLFQGPFKAVLVENNEQLLHASAYIHRNPREIPEWKDKEENYPWSSYQDYTKKNRWGELLKTDIILNQFSDPKEYKEFLETSGTKSNMLDTECLTCL